MTKQSIEDLLCEAFKDMPDGVPMVEIRTATALINKELLKAELRGLKYSLGDWHTFSNGSSPQWSRRIKDRIKELKATLSADSNKESNV